MAFASINLDFSQLVKPGAYFNYKNPPKPIKEYMDQLNAPIKKRNAEKEAKLGRPLTKDEKEHEWTTCAIQASHAFNATTHKVPAFSHRRPNYAIPGGNGYYIHAVDEMANWLTNTFGETDDLVMLGGKTMQSPIMGQPGIITFGNAHVELWDGTGIVQRGGGVGMDPTYIWSRKPILFWKIGFRVPLNDLLPEWLTGWWSVYDGNQYYYYFQDLPYVSYVKKKPANGSAPPPGNPVNQGKVRLTSKSLVITWNPIKLANGKMDTPTIETFFHNGASGPTEMNGTSADPSGAAKYSPLFARRMT